MDFFRFEDAALGDLLAAAAGEDRDASTPIVTETAGTQNVLAFKMIDVFNQPEVQNWTKSKWSCAACRKTFTRGFALRAHLRTHNNSKPFTCTICKLTFTRDHDRKMHENIHSGAKDFVCGEKHFGEAKGCGRSFSRAANLKRHLATCKGEPWARSTSQSSTQDRAASGVVATTPRTAVPSPIAIRHAEDAGRGDSNAIAEDILSQASVLSSDTSEPPSPAASLVQNADCSTSLAEKITALENKLKLYEKFWREKGLDVPAGSSDQNQDDFSFADAMSGNQSSASSVVTNVSSWSSSSSFSNKQANGLGLSKQISNSSGDNSILIDGAYKVERMVRSNSNNNSRTTQSMPQPTTNLLPVASPHHHCQCCSHRYHSRVQLRRHVFTHLTHSFRAPDPLIFPWVRDHGTSTVYCLSNPRFGEFSHTGRWGCGQQFDNLTALNRHFLTEEGRHCIQPVFQMESRVLQPYISANQNFDILVRQEIPFLPFTFMENSLELSEELDTDDSYLSNRPSGGSILSDIL